MDLRKETLRQQAQQLCSPSPRVADIKNRVIFSDVQLEKILPLMLYLAAMSIYESMHVKM